MAQSTTIATPTATGQWPTTLGGITLQVGGQPAELYYVSAGQINFLIPALTNYGTVTVVITNVSSGATQTATVTLASTAAAIFTSNASGSGAGAILNGVTGSAAPFMVVTPQNGGSDLRTRLAIYGTGIRYAGNPAQDPTITNVAANVFAQGTDTAGNLYNFTVEYAGSSDPAYPGLDQVNIILPAQLDGTSLISLIVSAGGAPSNTVTFQMSSLPASDIALAGLSLSTNETIGGTSVTGTVSLNGVARSNGFPISLRSSLPTTGVPSVVTIAQGQSTGTFNISTATTATTQSATITAQAAASSFTAALQIDPSNLPQLNSFTITPATVQGGTSFNGTVQLSQLAPLGGVNVQIASSSPTVVQPPATVNVLVNSSSANFTIPTTPVTGIQTATLSATLGSNTITQQVTVAPPIQLTLNPASVLGGATVTGTITLGNAAPVQGAIVQVTSSATAFAQVVGPVTIPSGQTTGAFIINTFAVTAQQTVTITATDGTVGSATAILTVSPQTTGQLQSLTISPAQILGGGSATGTVTLSGPAQFGGLIVALRSSNGIVAPVPLTVTVAQGSSIATFTINTSSPATQQIVTITATAGSITQTATLTVQ